MTETKTYKIEVNYRKAMAFVDVYVTATDLETAADKADEIALEMQPEFEPSDDPPLPSLELKRVEVDATGE